MPARSDLSLSRSPHRMFNISKKRRVLSGFVSGPDSFARGRFFARIAIFDLVDTVSTGARRLTWN